MLNICVSGATGWTGRELVRGVIEAEDMTLAGAVARQAAGQDVGAALGGAPSASRWRRAWTRPLRRLAKC